MAKTKGKLRVTPQPPQPASGSPRGVVVRIEREVSHISIDDPAGGRFVDGANQRVHATEVEGGATFQGVIVSANASGRLAIMRITCITAPGMYDVYPTTGTLIVTVLDGGPPVQPISVTYVEEP